MATVLVRCLMLVGVVLGVGLAGPDARADEPLPPVDGKVLLTVDGAVGITNADGGVAQFDSALLDSLPSATIDAREPWEGGAVRQFTGPRLDALLARVDAKGTTLAMIAADGYQTALPVTDATEKGAILARAMDGVALAGEYGPLWVILPASAQDAVSDDDWFHKHIWALQRITVE